MSGRRGRTSLFEAELAEQWKLATVARRAAEAAGDCWLVELMTGRLEDLREIIDRELRTPSAVRG